MTDTHNDYPTDEDGNPLIPESEVIGVFPRDTAWGHRIGFLNYDERRVSGHISPRATEDDLFAHQLESGRIGVYRLTNIERPHLNDPSDLFFADAEDAGYLNGLSLETGEESLLQSQPEVLIPGDCPECGSHNQELAVWDEDGGLVTKRRTECRECGHTEIKTKRAARAGWSSDE